MAMIPVKGPREWEESVVIDCIGIVPDKRVDPLLVGALVWPCRVQIADDGSRINKVTVVLEHISNKEIQV